MVNYKLLTWIVLLLFVSVVASKQKQVLKNVRQRNLLKLEPNYLSIVKEHNKVSKIKTKTFPNPILVYVTPWNNYGYEIAKNFTNKFDYVSPTWYQFEIAPKLRLSGQQDVDKPWIQQLRRNNPKVKIVPRFILVVNDASFSLVFGEDKTIADSIVDIIYNECLNLGFNGIVLDAGYLNFASKDPNHYTYLFQKLHSKFKNDAMELIFVIPAPREIGSRIQLFSPQELVTLEPYVDLFSVMTYDYSSVHRPGPNAPYPWVEQVISYFLPSEISAFTKKIMLGLNFYGNDFGLPGSGGPIMAKEYLELLTTHKPSLKWEDPIKENYFEYTGKDGKYHVVYYPTLMSIDERIKLARSSGVGIAIWEIGQGLDYFYDLF